MLFSTSIGIDLGTSTVLVYVKGKGIILREPSVVAIRKEDQTRIEAVGQKAYEMMGRTPKNLHTIRPLQGGVISDYQYTEKMLKYFVQRTIGKLIIRVHDYQIICGNKLIGIVQCRVFPTIFLMHIPNGNFSLFDHYLHNFFSIVSGAIIYNQPLKVPKLLPQ